MKLLNILNYNKNMDIYLENKNGNLLLNYFSKYASGSIFINSPIELVKAIEDVCGKGSYCLFYRPKNNQESPIVVNYKEEENYPNIQRISYWMQGIKTELIEKSRRVAIEVWGNIPEMEIGWIENKCKSYVD